ncbi:ABC-2 family transporter protein [Candidatus Dojkabacteria bacterium]|nr:ABC-2 family transporter protein [Candidatus Dojkabacteria bacterium]
MSEYRFNFWVHFFTPFFSLFVSLNIWRLVDLDSSSGSLFTNETIVPYFIWAFITQLILVNQHWEIATNIREGDIVNFVMKPISHFGRYHAQSVGFNLLRFLFAIAAAIVMYRIQFGVFGFRILLFVFSMILAHVIEFTVGYIVGVLAFWIKLSYGFYNMYMIFRYFFSGLVVPISLYGGLLAKVLMYLPFQAVFNTPIMMVMGKSSDLLFLLLIQIFWVSVLSVLSRLIYKRGLKKLEAVGI